jgi:hypothetical protein
MKRLAILFVLAVAVTLGGGWFSNGYTGNQLVSIVSINGVAATDGMVVSTPLTITVKVTTVGKASASPWTTAKIQWVAGTTGGTWADVTPVLTLANSGALELAGTFTAFGNDTLTLTKGAAYRIRVWVSDGTISNASTGVDTTGAGTNGWDNAWVINFTVHATNTKPGRPQ